MKLIRQIVGLGITVASFSMALARMEFLEAIGTQLAGNRISLMEFKVILVGGFLLVIVCQTYRIVLAFNRWEGQ